MHARLTSGISYLTEGIKNNSTKTNETIEGEQSDPRDGNARSLCKTLSMFFVFVLFRFLSEKMEKNEGSIHSIEYNAILYGSLPVTLCAFVKYLTTKK